MQLMLIVREFNMNMDVCKHLAWTESTKLNETNKNKTFIL